MEEPPHFMDSRHEPRSSDQYLYHYTSLETFEDYILPSNTLRLSTLENLNDPKEAKFSSSWSGTLNEESHKELKVKIEDFHANQIKVACFSRDNSNIEIQFDRSFPGYAKPSMWAHYGDSHKGVCLMFNKKMLISQFESTFSDPLRKKYAPVKYQELKAVNRTSMMSLNRTMTPGNISYFEHELTADFLKTMLDNFDTYNEEMYFRKHGDWSNENEFRFLIVSQDNGYEFLNYGKSLVAVATGFDMPENLRQKINSKLDTQNIRHLQMDSGWFTG